MKKEKSYKIASLFSGCGGMDLGCRGDFDFLGHNYGRLKTEAVYAMDFDKPICDIYNANFENKCYVQDICSLDAKDVPDHDILTGGFPCQSFSVVAQNPKRLGCKDSSKGMLFAQMSKILKEKNPAAFVAENVKGLLSANKGEAFPLIIKEFEQAGYYVKHKVLNAADFGIPQKRERVFMVGFKSESDYNNFKFPEPLASQPITLKAVVLPDSEVEEKYYFSDRAVKGMKSTKNSKIMNKGRAQNLDEPCNTVGAHLCKVSLNSTDPVLFTDGRYRMFTPREVARIQSFPDTFLLPGSRGVNYKALGNAVAPVLMWHVTKKILDVLDA